MSTANYIKVMQVTTSDKEIATSILRESTHIYYMAYFAF